VDFANIRDHVLSAVIVLVDVFACAHPLRLLHVYQPLILCLSYSAFSFVYFAVGGTSRLDESFVYSIQDWLNNPEKSAIYGLITIALQLIVFFGVWCLHFVADKSARAFSREEANCEATNNIIL